MSGSSQRSAGPFDKNHDGDHLLMMMIVVQCNFIADNVVDVQDIKAKQSRI